MLTQEDINIIEQIQLITSLASNSVKTRYPLILGNIDNNFLISITFEEKMLFVEEFKKFGLIIKEEDKTLDVPNDGKFQLNKSENVNNFVYEITIFIRYTLFYIIIPKLKTIESSITIGYDNTDIKCMDKYFDLKFL